MMLRTQDVAAYIGTRIHEARVARGVSAAELADSTSCTYRGIMRFERGDQEPMLTHVWEIALALGIEPADLMPSREEIERMVQQ